MAVTHVFAGIPVADHEAAFEWYERLLGRPPDRLPTEDEAVWELTDAGLDPAVWLDVVFAEGAGCLECSGTGYHGRTAICELLNLTDRIREMIVDRRPTSEIKRMAREEGMVTLRESGLAKIRAGITTLREIMKVTFVD